MCKSSVTGSLSPPDTGIVQDTWTNFASDFMTTYCVNCHDGMTPRPTTDFSIYQTVSLATRLVNIKCGTAPQANPANGCGAGTPPPEQFPVGGGPFPSDEERQTIVDWIDAGMPE